MKNLSVTLCTVFIGLIALGGALTFLPESSASSGMTAESSLVKFINEERQYSIEYPKEWQKQDLPSLDLVLIAPQKNDSSQANATMNIVSEHVGNSITLEQFYDESVKHLTNELQEVHIEKSGEMNLNHVPAKWILYSHIMLTTKFQVLQYFIVAKGNVFLLTFSSPNEIFEQYRQEFEHIASSFKLLPNEN